MNNQIVADYERLNQVALRFTAQAQTIQEILQEVQSDLTNLQGEWVGRGSNAFFAEMESEVLPATQRLNQAMEQAQQTTQTIIRTIQQADEEAARPFALR